MNKYEQLKELESQKKRYEEFFRECKEYRYVVLSKHPHKKTPFFEQTQSTRRVSGIPQIVDVPDTLYFYDKIMDAIEADYKRICEKFAELQKNL